MTIQSHGLSAGTRPHYETANGVRNGLVYYILMSKIKGAPGVHIAMAGCTILGGVHPVCARFLSHL